MTSIRPGGDGDPLPNGTLVFRIGKNAQLSPAALEHRKASPAMFTLSSDDEKSPGQRLSVWLKKLTIADQAWAFMGSNPANTVVACLEVDKIRAIVPPAGFVALDVQWEPAMTVDANGDKVPNTSPGAEGHCGIANLKQGGEGKTHKEQRKALRSMLADIADISPVPVPHAFREHELRLTAYFIWEGEDRPHGCDERHWVLAVQRVRRRYQFLGDAGTSSRGTARTTSGLAWDPPD